MTPKSKPAQPRPRDHDPQPVWPTRNEPADNDRDEKPRRTDGVEECLTADWEMAFMRGELQ